ncbi:MAG: hypothetical protein ACE14L_13965 [Terriglobales bacterium]
MLKIDQAKLMSNFQSSIFSDMQGRALMEARFGPLGSGQQRLAIGAIEYNLAELLSQLGVEFDDAKPIDAQATDAHFVIRYFDAQDARVVALEFDHNFHPMGELRAHIAEWHQGSDYFSFYAGH